MAPTSINLKTGYEHGPFGKPKRRGVLPLYRRGAVALDALRRQGRRVGTREITAVRWAVNGPALRGRIKVETPTDPVAYASQLSASFMARSLSDDKMMTILLVPHLGGILSAYDGFRRGALARGLPNLVYLRPRSRPLLTPVLQP